MNTSSETLHVFSEKNTTQDELAAKPTNKEWERLRDKSIDEWWQRAMDRVNDKNIPPPPVW